MKYNISSKYHFMFKTAGDVNIVIPMQAGSTILFTGQFLTYRQSGPSDSTADSGTFFNFLLMALTNYLDTLRSY